MTFLFVEEEPHPVYKFFSKILSFFWSLISTIFYPVYKLFSIILSFFWLITRTILYPFKWTFNHFGYIALAIIVPAALFTLLANGPNHTVMTPMVKPLVDYAADSWPAMIYKQFIAENYYVGLLDRLESEQQVVKQKLEELAKRKADYVGLTEMDYTVIHQMQIEQAKLNRYFEKLVAEQERIEGLIDQAFNHVQDTVHTVQVAINTVQDEVDTLQDEVHIVGSRIEEQNTRTRILEEDIIVVRDDLEDHSKKLQDHSNKLEDQSKKFEHQSKNQEDRSAKLEERLAALESELGNVAARALTTKLEDDVRAELQRVDRTGLPDYALESGGAHIIEDLTSPTYAVPYRFPIVEQLGIGHWSIWNKIEVVQKRGKVPSTALQPNTFPGNCWPLKGMY